MAVSAESGPGSPGSSGSHKLVVTQAEIVAFMVIGYLVFAVGMLIVQLARDMLQEGKDRKRG